MKLLTPKCAITVACPGIYDMEDGTVIVVGRPLDVNEIVKMSGLIDKRDVATVITMELFRKATGDDTLPTVR